MGDKPALSATPLEDRDLWAVSAYLIAISPDLQASAQKKRQQEQEQKKAKAAAVAALAEETKEGGPVVDVKPLLEKHCTQCHELNEIDDKPPKTKKEVDSLLSRMVDNGLEAPDGDLRAISGHLVRTYCK